MRRRRVCRAHKQLETQLRCGCNRSRSSQGHAATWSSTRRGPSDPCSSLLCREAGAGRSPSGNSRAARDDLANFPLTGFPLPTMHRAVEFAIDGEIGPAIGGFERQSFIKIDAETRCIARVHQALGKSVEMREYAVGFLRVPHEFLNTEIVNAQIKMQRGGHAHGAHIYGAVAPGADLIQSRQACDLPQVRYSTRMHNRRPDVVDELLLNELLAIVDRIENLADRYWRSGVLADEAQTFLQLGRNRIFEPEQVEGFEALSETCRFDRRQPVMHVMQQRKILAKFLPQPLE